MTAVAKKRNPNRFSEHDIARQKAEVLRGRMIGVSFAALARNLSEKTPDGEPIDEATVRRRYKAAVADYAVPRGQWEEYRNQQLAQITTATEKAMQAIVGWDTRLNDPKDLVGPLAALVKLQERADRVIGFPQEAPAPPPANAGALDYARSIVTNQVAHKAMLASMKMIETEILDVEILDE